MKYFLNGALGFLFSLVLLNAGVRPDSWHYWVLLVIIVVLITVQYIGREVG